MSEAPIDLSDALVRLLGKLDAIRPGLAAEAIEYVTTGANEEVLAYLRTKPECGRHLDLKLVGNGIVLDAPERARQFEAPGFTPERLWRIGKVYAACLYGARPHRYLDWVPDVPLWLECLIWEGSTLSPNAWSARDALLIDAPALQACIDRDANTPSELLAHLVLGDTSSAMAFGLLTTLRRMTDLGDVLRRHADFVRTILEGGDAQRTLRSLGALHEVTGTLDPWKEAIVRRSVAPSKRLRKAARRLLPRLGSVCSHLEALARDGKGDERIHAVDLLAEHGGERAREILARIEPGRSRKVAQHLEQVRMRLAGTPTEVVLDVPPLVPLTYPPLPESTAAAFDAFCERWRAWKGFWEDVPASRPPIPPARQREVLESVGRPAPWREPPPQLFEELATYPQPGDIWQELVAHRDLALIHLVRFAWHLGLLPERAPTAWIMKPVLAHRARREETYDLRTLANALAECGIPTRKVAFEVISDRPDSWWPADLCVPFYLENFLVLEEALGMRPAVDVDTWFHHDLRALDILAHVPVIPRSFHERLWELALGGEQRTRQPAQRCLDRIEGCEARLIETLGHGRSAVRSAGACWIARRRLTSARAALKTALAKERTASARADLANALAALGAPQDDTFDVRQLAQEAEATLARGIPETLAWLTFHTLPTLHDREGVAVPHTIRDAWIVEAMKLKRPDASTHLVERLAWIDEADRHAFAQAILERWIAYDTERPRQVTAEKEQELRDEVAQWMGVIPGDADDVYAFLVRSYLATPERSAIAFKGLLALVGASGGPAVTPPIQRYLNTWYGNRAAQCKALLHVLAHVPEPSATQLLFATSVRFRTPGIRSEATRLVHELAQRRNWSVEQLADRTIPTAGFDETGRIELYYGSVDQDAQDVTVTRSFLGTLDHTMSLRLEDAAGKPLKSLPAPRKAESQEVAQLARAALSWTRTELKTVVQVQTGRLYQAMCAERRWTFDELQRYLFAHPIVGRICTRLIFCVERENALLCWRLLDDGSLTNAHDDEVALQAEEAAFLLHGSMLSLEERMRWMRHFEEYEVEPLFEQLQREPITLDAKDRDDFAIYTCRGCVTRAFALRAIAKARGYLRGETGDGGWFDAYVKPIPALTLQVTIEFSGNQLPEEDREVTLHSLSFRRGRDGRGGDARLDDLPRLLIQESLNDLHAFAATGTGLDPARERR